MIQLDVNLLIYAHFSRFPLHEAAHAWLDDSLSSPEPVGLPWETLTGFARMATNGRVFPDPDTPAQAWQQIELWLSAPAAWIPIATDRHLETMRALWPAVESPRHVPDAHLAALAIEHGLELCTTDRGFARYPGLRWRNPLAE